MGCCCSSSLPNPGAFLVRHELQPGGALVENAVGRGATEPVMVASLKGTSYAAPKKGVRVERRFVPFVDPTSGRNLLYVQSQPENGDNPKSDTLVQDGDGQLVAILRTCQPNQVPTGWQKTSYNIYGVRPSFNGQSRSNANTPDGKPLYLWGQASRFPFKSISKLFLAEEGGSGISELASFECKRLAFVLNPPYRYKVSSAAGGAMLVDLVPGESKATTGQKIMAAEGVDLALLFCFTICHEKLDEEIPAAGPNPGSNI